jgi:hypothetical protein
MHSPPDPVPTPFLQKFHGKQQKLSRDGLLHLLYQNKPAHRDSDHAEGQSKTKVVSIRAAISVDQKSSEALMAETPLKPTGKL